MESKTIKVPFVEGELLVLNVNGKLYAGIKKVAESLGLDWKEACEGIKKDAVLSQGLVIMKFETENGNDYEALCLPMEYLIGWIMKLAPNDKDGKMCDKIIRCQRKNYMLLGLFIKSVLAE